MGKGKKNGGWMRKAAASTSASTSTPDKKFRAQTPGCEDNLYVLGEPDSAAKFIFVTDVLSTYFAGHVPRNGAKLAQSMTSLTRPDHTEPAEPAREYRNAKTGVETKERTTLVKEQIAGATPQDATTTETYLVVNEPIVAESDWAMVLKKYEISFREWKKNVEEWKEVSGTAFFLLRGHCPPTTMSKVKGHAGWTQAEADADVVGLLKIIRDLAHSVEEEAHTTIATVKRDLDLFSCFMTKTESPEDYEERFNARIKVVDAHDGQAGWNKPLYEEHLKEAMAEIPEGLSSAAKIEAIKAAEESARKTSAGEYLAELFLILACRERFGNLRKLFKNNQVTAEKQKKLTCIRDVVYIMNTYDLSMYASNTPRAAEVVDDAGLAFQETQTWTQAKRDCYCCGKELGKDGHPNSWHKCGNVNGAKKAEVAKKFAEGFFSKSYRAPKKKGNDTVPAAVHVNVEDVPAEEAAEEVIAPGSKGKWPGTTPELYVATGYTMSEVEFVEKDTGRVAGDWDTVEEFGVACIELLEDEWRTPTRNGHKPTTK